MTGDTGICLKVYTDGGSRGNPGDAAAGVVVRSADDGTVLREEGIFLGRATNNVAEYRALLAGLAAAADLSAAQVEVFSDSELMVRQMNGEYRVRNAGLRPLFAQAQELVGRFARFAIRHIPREENALADELAGRAMNVRRNVGDAAP